MVETGEAREVHHFSVLIGYGATAINPYLAFETISQMVAEGSLGDLTAEKAHYQYVKAAVKGVLKVISKMGISTLQSYHGAQIFEALGLAKSWSTTTSPRHRRVFKGSICPRSTKKCRHATTKASRRASMGLRPLDAGGVYQWRHDGERHLFNPQTIHQLQQACRTNNYSVFKQYAATVNNQSAALMTLAQPARL